MVCLHDDDYYFTAENMKKKTFEKQENIDCYNLYSTGGQSSIEQDDNHQICEIEMINGTSRIKFKKWEDRGVQDLKDFNIFYSAYENLANTKKPIMVHSYSDTSRTGIFILYDTLMRKIKKKTKRFL